MAHAIQYRTAHASTNNTTQTQPETYRQDAPIDFWQKLIQAAVCNSWPQLFLHNIVPLLPPARSNDSDEAHREASDSADHDGDGSK